MTQHESDKLKLNLTNDNSTAGGEPHQHAAPSEVPITTNQSLAISDDQNSLRAGDLGPTLLEDFILREKITHFDHARGELSAFLLIDQHDVGFELCCDGDRFGFAAIKMQEEDVQARSMQCGDRLRLDRRPVPIIWEPQKLYNR